MTESVSPPFACRIGCGACCIAPSLVGAFPNMPMGKAAGVRCANLDTANRCVLWGTPDYPSVCRGFSPEADICGDDDATALRNLVALDALTRPRR
ncbi:MAG: YkgJ family cysteine cluster protein [Myxococcales bacterium]|nr:YkgJ family cysteine cluster protein [Myxococcales bacterium]